MSLTSDSLNIIGFYFLFAAIILLYDYCRKASAPTPETATPVQTPITVREAAFHNMNAQTHLQASRDAAVTINGERNQAEGADGDEGSHRSPARESYRGERVKDDSVRSVREDDCPICISGLKDEKLCTVLPICNHRFHSDCIAIWLATNKTCPLSRECYD